MVQENIIVPGCQERYFLPEKLSTTLTSLASFASATILTGGKPAPLKATFGKTSKDNQTCIDSYTKDDSAPTPTYQHELTGYSGA